MPSFLTPRVCFALFFVLLAAGLGGVAMLIRGAAFPVWGSVAAVGGIGCWSFAILGAFRRADG